MKFTPHSTTFELSPMKPTCVAIYGLKKQVLRSEAYLELTGTRVFFGGGIEILIPSLPHHTPTLVIHFIVSH